MTDEAELEKEIQAKGLVAPRLTPDAIDEQIVGEQYWRPDHTTMTVCALQLRNGFVVIGESAAASAANFDEGIGRRIARENARKKIWQFEGYRLCQHLYEARGF